MVLSDAQLVERARCRDHRALQELVERYKRKIYYTALGIVGNHHDAEDVMQEALLQALRSLERLRKPDGFGAWVLRIAFNRAVDLRRRRKREVMPENGNDGNGIFDVVECERPQENPERVIMSDEIRRAVREVMESLPESQRVAFSLKHVAQLSIREIAEATSSSESTVKTNIYRAVQRMRSALSPQVVQGSGVANERAS